MRRCSREWPFPRRMIRAQKPCPPMSLRQLVHQSWPWRGEIQSSWGGEKILHPSQPVVTAGEISHPLRALMPRGGPIQFPWAKPSKPPVPLMETLPPSKPSLPVWALAVVQPTTPPCSFAGVTACLQTQEPLEMASEAPHDTLSIGVVATPRISTMTMSHIIRDEVMGLGHQMSLLGGTSHLKF